jgi:hypothetical protein
MSAKKSHANQTKRRTGIVALRGTGFGDEESPGAGDQDQDNPSETGNSVIEVGKKMAEGVVGGWRTIGGIFAGNQNPSTMSKQPTQSYSRSSPEPSVLPTSPVKSSFGKLLDGFSPGIESSQSSPSGGSVLIIDLDTSSLITQFSPSLSPPSILSFSPSSTEILVGNEEATHFDIFEIRLASRRSRRDIREKVWHRYRLERGMTRAEVKEVRWREDGREVGIVTGRGTIHVWAVRRMGGKVKVEEALNWKEVNVDKLVSLLFL